MGEGGSVTPNTSEHLNEGSREGELTQESTWDSLM